METHGFLWGGDVTWLYEQGWFCSSLLVDQRAEISSENAVKGHRGESHSAYLSMLHLASSRYDSFQVAQMLLSLMRASFVKKKEEFWYFTVNDSRQFGSFQKDEQSWINSLLSQTDLPLLWVPILSTVGVNHPAYFWAQQRPGRVQQWLHQFWRAAVHPYGDHLLRSVGNLHRVGEQAAVG